MCHRELTKRTARLTGKNPWRHVLHARKRAADDLLVADGELVELYRRRDRDNGAFRCDQRSVLRAFRTSTDTEDRDLFTGSHRNR